MSDAYTPVNNNIQGPGYAFGAAMKNDSPEDNWQNTANRMYILNRPYARPASETNNYTTDLSGDQEKQFRQWVGQNKVPFDPDGQANDYDMRGYWKDVVSQGGNEQQRNTVDGQMHFPDTYKTPFHQSFSEGSKYALPSAPEWVGPNGLPDLNGHQLRDKASGRIVYDETLGRH